MPPSGACSGMKQSGGCCDRSDAPLRAPADDAEAPLRNNWNRHYGQVTTLRTERLSMREWKMDDLDELTDLFSHPEVWRFPLRRGFHPEETADFLRRRLTEWEQQRWGLWALAHDDRLIGYAGFALPTLLPEIMPIPEIGWRLHPAYWGRGLATEAALAALGHGFGHLGFEEVVSIYEPERRLRTGHAADRNDG